VKIAVLGTGSAGRTVAAGLARLGHEVVIGTRDPVATRKRADWDSDLPLEEYAVVADGADIVVNATNGQASLAVFDAIGGQQLSGKVVLDLANALDFSGGFPPRMAVDDTDSLAEQIQRAFPQARVVKALNTVTAGVMVDPGKVGDGETTVFAASDDAEARAVVVALLEQLGWRDVVEFEELAAARGLEMWLPLWVRLMARLGTADFNLKVVR
jgi:8-hydroxy-5-deazaflavin:NADPH oxidoreductase